MTQAQTIVTQARTWLGTKYHHQGRLKKSSTSGGGVDCIGLIMGIARELELTSTKGRLLSEFDTTNYSIHPDGISLKRFLGQHLVEIGKDNLSVGDVLLFKFFEHPQHVGIASNYNKHQGSNEYGVIHCYSGSGEVVEHILSPAWHRMIVGAYRFKDIMVRI